MTKNVRIENADTSDHKVRVWTEQRVGGEWVRQGQPTELAHPAMMHTGLIHQDQRLVVEEAPREPKTGGT